MSQEVSLKQIFQQEFTKIVAVISRQFGLRHMAIAEDLVSETFLAASETWGIKGMPDNPRAWLYAVARQKALYHFRRNKIYHENVLPHIVTIGDHTQTEVVNFSDENIRDSQLQMMFAVCNPVIASEAQIGLALRILCGFGIDEIAEAFFTNKETINKRLFRAREKMRTEHIELEMPPASEIKRRLDSVLHVIYLLFTEGYYSKTQNQILRRDFCIEAMRLAVMLTEYAPTNLPKTNALLALMCFHASRFDARQNETESYILYEDQDESRWDQQLISQGMRYLELSAAGDELTSFHIEARIAFWHCHKDDTPEKWQSILGLYDQLLEINYSPSVALNRAFALYKVQGASSAIAEVEKLQWTENHFYFLFLGELYQHIDTSKARQFLERAFDLARTDTERTVIARKINNLV